MMTTEMTYRFRVPWTAIYIILTAFAATLMLIGILGGTAPAEKELDAFTSEHEIGHNVMPYHDVGTAEEARLRAIWQAEAEARAERASAELGVTVTPEDLWSSAAEH